MDIDEGRLYTISEITNLGLIKPPSGSDNPITVYHYIRRLILSKKLKANISKNFSKHWEVPGSAIMDFHNSKKES